MVVGFGVEQPLERIPSRIRLARLGLQLRQVRDPFRNGAGMPPERFLAVAVSAKRREFTVKRRSQFAPGVFDESLCRIGNRLRGDPGSADLCDGV